MSRAAETSGGAAPSGTTIDDQLEIVRAALWEELEQDRIKAVKAATRKKVQRKRQAARAAPAPAPSVKARRGRGGAKLPAGKNARAADAAPAAARGNDAVVVGEELSEEEEVELALEQISDSCQPRPIPDDWVHQYWLVAMVFGHPGGERSSKMWLPQMSSGPEAPATPSADSVASSFLATPATGVVKSRRAMREEGAAARGSPDHDMRLPPALMETMTESRTLLREMRAAVPVQPGDGAPSMATAFAAFSQAYQRSMEQDAAAVAATTLQRRVDALARLCALFPGEARYAAAFQVAMEQQAGLLPDALPPFNFPDM